MGEDLSDGDCALPGIEALGPPGVNQGRLIRWNYGFTVAQVRIMEPVLWAIIQLFYGYSRTVEMEAVQDDADILFPRGEKQFPHLGEGLSHWTR